MAVTREAALARLRELIGAEDDHRSTKIRAELRDALERLRAGLANEPDLIIGLIPPKSRSTTE